MISTVCGVSSAASFLPAARLRFGHAEVFEPNPDSADPVQDRSTNVLPFKRLVGRASRNFRFLLTGRLPEVDFSSASVEYQHKQLKRLARETGLEPATSGVTGRRSNQLSYSPAARPGHGRAGDLPDRIGAGPSQALREASPAAGRKRGKTPALAACHALAD
jgi:hypothetical protein